MIDEKVYHYFGPKIKKSFFVQTFFRFGQSIIKSVSSVGRMKVNQEGFFCFFVLEHLDRERKDSNDLGEQESMKKRKTEGERQAKIKGVRERERVNNKN